MMRPCCCGHLMGKDNLGFLCSVSIASRIVAYSMRLNNNNDNSRKTDGQVFYLFISMEPSSPCVRYGKREGKYRENWFRPSGTFAIVRWPKGHFSPAVINGSGVRMIHDDV